MKPKLLLHIVGTLLVSSAISSAQPVITNQPQSQGVIRGGEVTFWVGATGVEPLSYQWQQAYDYVTYTDRPAATNDSLTITNVQNTDAANYRVIVSNSQGAVTSVTAQLTILVPPTISSYGQPTNFPCVSLGASVTNRVVAGGSTPLRYQWRHDGVPLPGKTTSAIILSNLVAADAGLYDVVVTNLAGSVTSSAVTLDVDPTFIKVTQPDIVQGTPDMWTCYWVELTGDEWLDLVVVGGFNTSGGKPLVVFQNNGDGTLSRNPAHDLSQVSGRLFSIAWADLDNDGDLDGIVGSHESQAPSFLRNEGANRFTRLIMNSLWTANGIAPIGSSATCADIDNDGILDAILGYWGNTGGIWGTNAVLRGLGENRFWVDRASPMALSHTWSEFWSWADWNGDGRLDLYGATSGNTSQVDLMFQNIGNGQFLRITTNNLVQVPDISIAAAWGDYNNDGRLDVCVTSWNQTNQLFRNLGNDLFAPDPASPSFPVNVERTVAEWADYDNDGWLDLFVAHGDRPGRLFHNRGDGTLQEVTTGSPVREAQGYGCAWGDYNNDGFPDLFVPNSVSGVNYLYRNNLRNVGNANGWLKVKLVGTASNRNGIGARIQLRATIGGADVTQMRQIACQGYEAALVAHFGLGDAANVTTLRVEWPSGIVQELQNVATNQFLTVVESQGYTNAPPQFSGAVKSADGVELSFQEPAAGASYILEASTNLVTWTKLMARTSASGTAQFTDTRAGSYSKRFYRLQVP